MQRSTLSIVFTFFILLPAALCTSPTAIPTNTAPAAPVIAPMTGAVPPARVWIPILHNSASSIGPTGAVYYVSRTGSNGNGLSWATAWNELDQIGWSAVQPGDTILLDGGNTACDFPVTVGDTNAPTPACCGRSAPGCRRTPS